MSKRKYRPIYTINSLEEFEDCKSLWFEVRGRMWHRAALENLQVRTLCNWLYRGDVSACERIEKVKEEEPRELSPVMKFWQKELLKSIDSRIYKGVIDESGSESR